MGINLEKIKEMLKGKFAIVIICGALFIVSLLGGGKELAKKANMLPEPTKIQMESQDSEWSTTLTKLLPYGKTARFFKNTVQFIESERGAYEDIIVLKSNIGYLLKTIGVENAKVYIKTHNIVSGNKILYAVDMISIFTESDELKNEYSELITQVLKDNIEGTFDVKVYGKLNTGK